MVCSTSVDNVSPPLPKGHHCDSVLSMWTDQAYATQLPKTFQCLIYGLRRMTGVHSRGVHGARCDGNHRTSRSSQTDHRGGTGFSPGQRMNSMPLLSNSNCFAALLVEEVYESDSISSTITAAEDTTAILTSPTLRSQLRKHPNWEKQLPE